MAFLPVLPRLTERGFEREVTRYAEMMGWRVYEGFLNRPSPRGFPQLVLIRARHPSPRVVFALVKADRGHLTESERTWLRRLRHDGYEAWVFRPRDRGTIERILR